MYLIEEYFPFLYFGLARLRAYVLKITFKRMGKRVSIQYGCIFKRMRFIEIGDGVYINHHAEILGQRCGLSIGNNVMIGQYAKLITNNHNYFDRNELISKQGSTLKKITIGDDVWIGANAIILPGITIHKGAIVGAGAVVTKDVPQYTVVAGVPAKAISHRI